jgi:hypothetical protein
MSKFNRRIAWLAKINAASKMVFRNFELRRPEVEKVAKARSFKPESPTSR